MLWKKEKGSACVFMQSLLRRNSCRAASLSQFCGEGLFGKSLFLGICYALALCSAVQEEMVALATLFE